MTLVASLAQETGSSEHDIQRLINSAPRRYKTFPIPKRNGEPRIIAQPAVEIKILQRLLVSRFLAQLPVHGAAYAYVRGRNIRMNAMQHSRSDHLLKLDFTNFFNSLRPVELERVLRVSPIVGINRADFESIYHLAFWGCSTPVPTCLSVGAPSSPHLSNVIMFEFDKALSQIAHELDVKYTRYADDITASCSGSSTKLHQFEKRVAAELKRCQLPLAFNEKKRGIYGRGDRRMVTGLIITPDGSISIGRDRKREIKSVLYTLKSDHSDAELLMRGKGLLSFVLSAEPAFFRSLVEKYGFPFIKLILESPIVSLWDGVVES